MAIVSGLFFFIKEILGRFSYPLNPVAIAKTIACVVITLSLLQPGVSSSIEVVTGDLAPRGNADGILNAADLMVLERIVLEGQTPSAEELLAGDVAPLGSPDGELNAGDLVVLERAVFGLITLPVTTSNDPPLPADINLISVSDPLSGQVQITGVAGSVAGGATVAIVNFETGDSVLVSANTDGSFTAGLQADFGHTLSVAILDSGGSPGPSVSVGVGTIIDMQITSPQEGVLIDSDSVLVSGIINGPVNTGVTVNGQVACVIGNRFYAENVPLLMGGNNLIVKAKTVDGLTTSLTRAVSSGGPGLMRLNVDSPCGYAAHTAAFTIINDSNLSIQQIDIDFDGDGVSDLGTTDPAAISEYTYSNPGVYPVTATITDALGATYSLVSTVVVSDVSVTDSMLQGLYVQMKDRLRRGATEGALNTVSSAAYEKYRDIFAGLDGSLSVIVDQLGVIDASSIGAEMAEYLIVREEAGVRYDYMIYLMRGEDGVWRINSM